MTYDDDPLVQELRPRYPLTIAALAAIPEGARHLQRIVDLDRTWMAQQFAPQTPPVVVEHGEVDLPTDTPFFDLVYAGGGLNLLNAAVMTGVHRQRVLVFDRFTVGAVHREWNISWEELQALVEVGLLGRAELATIVQRRYARGLVRFSAEGIRVRPAALWMDRVLDVAVDADDLTALCLRKIRAASSANVVLDGISFERAIVGHERVVIQVRDAHGAPCHFAARLLIDGMGATSPVACQLNCGAPYALVCPTVGTVARGYQVSHDGAPGTIDPDLGEILVTTEDARAGHQLIWEAFPGRSDQAAIYLFYYRETGTISRRTRRFTKRHESYKGYKSHEGDELLGLPSLLLPLFEEFFARLPTYKATEGVEILKPVYGFIPAGYKNVVSARKVLAFDRVLSLGDAAALQSPLTFCGFGSNARNLRRVTDLLHLALVHDRLRATDLGHIRAAEAVPALARAFSKFLIAKPSDSEPAYQVNETINVFCRILAEIGPRAAREFFQDRVRWWDYTRLVLRTALVYPRIFPLTFRTLTWGDGITWVASYLAFTAAALRNATGRAVLAPLSRTAPARALDGWLWRRAPGMAWRLAAAGAALLQAIRVYGG